MPTLYALNMTADLSNDSSGFFNAYVANSNSRNWYFSTDNGQTWQACNNGSNNSDVWYPTLQFSRGGSGNRDQVQFAVFPVNSPANMSISMVRIYAAFGRFGQSNAPSSVAAPFMNGNNTRTLLGDDGVHSTAAPAYFIGPYTVAVNPAAVNSNGRLKFEFSLNATFTLTDQYGNTQTYEYGYDPELDIDVGN